MLYVSVYPPTVLQCAFFGATVVNIPWTSMGKLGSVGQVIVMKKNVSDLIHGTTMSPYSTGYNHWRGESKTSGERWPNSQNPNPMKSQYKLSHTYIYTHSWGHGDLWALIFSNPLLSSNGQHFTGDTKQMLAQRNR